LYGIFDGGKNDPFKPFQKELFWNGLKLSIADFSDIEFSTPIGFGGVIVSME